LSGLGVLGNTALPGAPDNGRRRSTNSSSPYAQAYRAAACELWVSGLLDQRRLDRSDL